MSDFNVEHTQWQQGDATAMPPASSPLGDIEAIDGFPMVGDGSGLSPDGRFYKEEVQSALRNHGMPLEALRYPVTPAGLHYLIIHFDIPGVDASDWSLRIGGLVSKPVRLTLSEIRDRPAITMPVTMECAGNGRALLTPRSTTQPWMLDGIGTAEWTGTRLQPILAEAGLADSAVEVLFTGLDWGIQGGEVQAYQRSLTVAEAMRDEVMLVYAMNGQPLPPQHGYPLRLVVPGWYGMTSVKWLAQIEVLDLPFTGYQMMKSYRYASSADDPGQPVTLIKPRALMAPPGIPDFATRVRVVKAGLVRLTGRAWAGRAGIARVEVSTESDRRWAEAELEAPLSTYAWRAWSYQWEAEPGRYTLCVRATDDRGNHQPIEPPWNFQGMGNNMVQRVEVMVI